jgi:hypothetical protein
MINQLLALVCVVGLAIGQILFKLSANSLAETGSLFATKTLATLVCAFGLYGTVTLAWVWLLQKAELGQMYPFVALTFVLVPIGSYFIFNERFGAQYMFGVAFVMLGIFLTVKSSA